MNKPKTYDNTLARDFIRAHWYHRSPCWGCRQLDDVLTGVLTAQTEGDSATRTLSRKHLRAILERCPTVSVQAVAEVLPGSPSDRTFRKYAAASRVASMAVAALVARMPTLEEQEAAWLASPAGIDRIRVLGQPAQVHPVDEELSELLRAALLASTLSNATPSRSADPNALQEETADEPNAENRNGNPIRENQEATAPQGAPSSSPAFAGDQLQNAWGYAGPWTQSTVPQQSPTPGGRPRTPLRLQAPSCAVPRVT